MYRKGLCVFVLCAVFAQEVQPASWWPWGGRGKEEHNLNWVLDTILQSVSHDLVLEHGDSIAIPDSAFEATDKVPFLWFQLTGSASSKENGILKNLSSVVRVNDADIIQETESGSVKHIILKAELTLTDLEVQYSDIAASVGYLYHSGGVAVSCAKNSFQVAIKISDGSSCKAELQSAKINHLSGCTVKLAKAGLLSFFKQYFFGQALNQVIDDVVTKGSVKLPNILNPVLESHNICQYLDH